MPSRRHLQDGSGAVEAAPPPPPPRPHRHPTRAIPLRNHLLIPIIAGASVLAVLAFIAGVLLCRWRRRRKRGSKTAPSSPHSSPRSPSSDLKKAHQIQQGKGGMLVPLPQQHHEPQPQPQPQPQQPFSGPRRFTYDQLRRATAGLSPANKLGQGGFGPVFRGAVPLPVAPGGVLLEEVAVKQMESGSLQGEIEFQNELSLAASMTRPAEGKFDDEELMRLQLQVRKHVVLPLGFCSEDEPEDEWEARRRQQRKKKKKKRRKKKKRPNWFDAVDDDEDSDSDSDRVASGLDIEEGGEEVRKRVLLLVYELMHNGSLQDCLLVRKCPELMNWPRRFTVAMDVARALKFLHTTCDPPVVHGDIKPSNVLLDSRFNAKIADFGLARRLPVYAPSPEAASPSAGGGIPNAFKRKGDAVDLIGKDAGAVVIAIGGGGGDDNESTCTAAETESTFTAGGGVVAIDVGGRGSPEDDGCLSLPPPEGEEEPGSPDISPMRLEVASACEVGGFDRLSVDSGTMDAGGSRNGGGYPKKNASYGKDWWWWQDPGVGAPAKMTTSHVNDYVMEWIGSEVRKVPPNGTSNWAAVGGASNGSGTAATESSGTAAMAMVASKKKHPRAAREWWAFLDEERQKKSSGWKKGGNGTHHHPNQRRPPREWWREEFCEELARKSKKKQQQVQANSATIRSVLEEGHATPLHSRKQHRRRRSWSRGSRASSDWRGPDTPSGLGRRPSHDWAATASGDIPRSCAVSSTPSMRGTVCYAAPECGLSGEPPSEKCDIYSFGVLLLVIVSGRRPLQVTASPMSEFERANLVAWARGLACRGKNLLDLLDPGLQGPVDGNQALLCVTVALLCLQRSPSRRPSIAEVVAMLSGEMELPHLPVEYSPSPQSSNYPFRSSRRKTRPGSQPSETAG